MNESLHQAWEVQFNQLLQETDIYLYAGASDPVYKKQGELWNPMEWTQQNGFTPLAEVEFPIGSIAIHPNGTRYVKGHAFRGGPQHAMEIQLCKCGRQLCWLRVDSMNKMDHVSLLPNHAVAHVGGFGDSDGTAILHADLGELPNTGVMLGYPRGSDFPIDRMRRDAPSIRPGGSGQIGHDMFNNSRIASEQPPPDSVTQNALQEVPITTGPSHYTILFNQQGGGIPLTLEGINSLDGRSPAFQRYVSLGTKASIRFKFKCWKNIPDIKRHTDKRRQVNIRDSKRKPISFRKMAEIVFSELTEEMRTVAGLGHPPLCHSGMPIKVEDLVLVRIERITQGTLQPVFVLRQGIRVEDGGRQL